MKKIALALTTLLATCTLQAQDQMMFTVKKDSSAFELTQAGASQLASLPLKCILQQFPNKTSHTSGNAQGHALLPQQLHPAFYGCFDWHSSVHGHWMLVKLLKHFPGLPQADAVRNLLNTTITPASILQEVKYFDLPLTASRERTYGRAWLLKLDEELYTWDSEDGRRWHAALRPLTKKITELCWRALRCMR